MTEKQLVGLSARKQEAKSVPLKLRVINCCCEKGVSNEEPLEVKQVVRKSKQLGKKCEVGQQY